MDALGKYVILVRDDDAVDAIAHGRVRAFEPAPATDTDPGDARGPGEYVAFVVIATLDDPRVGARIPAHRQLMVARCYGRTLQEASALRWAVSNAVHLRGAQVYASGLGVYQSIETAGGRPVLDPDTSQPYHPFIFSALATTVAVT